MSPRCLSIIALGLLLATCPGCAGPDEQTAEPAGPEVRGSTGEHALRDVVDAYIREHTMEGVPYYIDSRETEFQDFEEGIAREGSSRVCVARFVSGTDVFRVAFYLQRELNAFVITRVVLRSINADSLQRTLYSRDALVL